MLCVYCGQEKPEGSFTKEHVIPKAIGGNLTPTNPFALNQVCQQCNSRCGAYVDGPFIKSWFTHNHRSQNSLKYVDLENGATVSLSYMGQMELSFCERICDFWLGPTGDRIYHFHLPYPEEPDVSPMVGRPSFARSNQVDKGFAFLFICAKNKVWWPTVVHSFIDQFEGSNLYLGNGPTPQGGPFEDIPSTLAALHEQLKLLNSQYHKVGVRIGTHYGSRFIVKIALGLGALILNPAFINSSDADLLRQALWCKKIADIEKMQIFGANLLSGRNEIKRYLGWDGVHLIVLFPTRSDVALSLILYGQQEATIKITSDPAHWSGKIPQDGSIYVIVPGLRKYAGPIDLPTYIAWKINGAAIKPLDDLKQVMDSVPALPSFDA